MPTSFVAMIYYNKECYVDMLYDNALDDGPMLVDDLACLTIATNSWEDKNDKLAVCDGALIHESPILFLNSHHHTIEEKYAYVEKY